MARQVNPVGENKFIKGLITEATALQFPTDACTYTWDAIFDETGRVTRRLGFDVETGNTPAWTSLRSTDVVNEYLWKTVAGDGNIQFQVVQLGSYLYFYNVSSSDIVSTNKLPFHVYLNTYIPTDGLLDPKNYPCQFASGNGDLLVVNRAIDPIYIEYDPELNTITVTEISLNIRDFRGLFDGLTDGQRITSSLASLITNNPAHYYNIINQSWHTGDALTQWDTARTDMPSNRDIMSIFRGSTTDAFDNAIVTGSTGSNTLAPKGHFVLNAFSPDRATALTDEGFSAVTFTETVTINQQIPQATGTAIGTAPTHGGALTVAFDGVTSAGATTGPTWVNNLDVYVGKNYTGAAKAISKAIVYGSNNWGFYGLFFSSAHHDTVDQANFTIRLYGKNSAPPSTVSDGTLLGSTTFTEQTNESGGRTITSSDSVTTYDYVWVRITANSAPLHNGTTFQGEIFCEEVEFFIFAETDVATSDDIFTTERPTTTEFYAGRAWYAGVTERGINGNIYFSQIIERPDQYGRAYQKNDPTGEEFFDLLADDGGVITIPDAGQIVRLFAYQQAMLVLATNGVWVIQGSGGGAFLATDYEVKKISSSGTNSPLSVTSYRSVPFWWGYEGLFTITFDPNYGSFVVTSISDQTIRTFVNTVPSANKEFVKGAANSEDSVLYWIYNSNDPLDTGDRYKYNKVLAMNMLSGAFYPWTIGDAGTADVRGISWIQSISASAVSKIKYVVTYSTGIFVTFGEAKSTTYTDWDAYSADTESFLTLTSLTKFEDLTSNESAVFNGSVEAAASAGTKTSATAYYWGVTTGTPRRAGRALVVPSTDQGFVNGATPQVTVTLYGKTGTAPSGGTDGTILGSKTVTDFNSTAANNFYVDVPSTNRTSAWDHLWVSVSQSGSSASMYLSEVLISAVATDATQELDYTTEFITGYRIDGQAQRFFQSNYVFVYLEQQANSSCFLNGVWDFTNSGSSGKWSSTQQIYNSALTLRNVNHRRLKVRGKGKSLQLRFVSETGKPFTIIGWSIWQTQNASV